MRAYIAVYRDEGETGVNNSPVEYHMVMLLTVAETRKNDRRASLRSCFCWVTVGCCRGPSHLLPPRYPDCRLPHKHSKSALRLLL